ncbi:MAG: Calcium-transporting ATPase 1 [Chlamydiae bacterium]|nr:Calcium-transporting ATPase 1 [Chlamydiota bacterium]
MTQTVEAQAKGHTDDIPGLFDKLKSGAGGLSSAETKKRLEQYGPNALVEKKANPILKFLTYFWGPIPWMIEIAAVLSVISGDWVDFAIIMTLLLFNSVVGFWQEFQAGNAVEALKKKLASKSRVLRDGAWKVVDASELVPGDVIRIRLGDIIPADVTLIDGEYLSIDQSAMTGESLPVTKKIGDSAYSGSVAKQGEMIGVVTETGANTFFGKTTELVMSAKSVSHFQKAVIQIGDFLIYISLALITILIIVQLERGDSFLSLIQFALILAVASIPVALPAVLSVTMAAGALLLSKKKAIVTRLDSIEEMAGMDILCSDKTGTLTQNKLVLQTPVPIANVDTQELILTAALASKEENQDPIDLAVIHGLDDKQVMNAYEQTKFVPFDPVSKRTEATIKSQKSTFRVTKGAPQVILKLCNPNKELADKVQGSVQDFASKGYRTLGVARSEDGKNWEFLGLLPMADPLRVDSVETVKEAGKHGIGVKMVTGDNIAIAKEIAGQLHLGQDIYPASDLIGEKGEMTADAAEKIEAANGFAEVFPEHKFGIVQALQKKDHIVGMTGDGVNDSPALKQANVGIAVSGATEAAQAAASLVLTLPGLSVIIHAIEEARRIFERMNSYAIYRIVETIRIMFFIVLTMLAYNIYPITAVMIILLALMNDLPIMTIAYDNTYLDPKPVRWKMGKVLTIATILGIIGVFETFFLFVFAKSFVGIAQEQLQTLIFLKLVVAGHLTLFVTRSKKAFFMRPFPAPILLGAILTTQCLAALIAGLGIFVTAIPWIWIVYVWMYCIVWIFIEDGAKLLIYRHFDREPKKRFFARFYRGHSS